jgi:WD40 repeat protein
LKKMEPKLKYKFCQRLGDSFKNLASYLGIPVREWNAWQPGSECDEILEWLKNRDRLKELPEALEKIEREDLVDLIQKSQSSDPLYQFFEVPPTEREIQNVNQDWGEAKGQDVAAFFGRTKELEMLEKWILKDKCRLVAVIGIAGIGKTDLSLQLGGIGKTNLSLTLVKQIQDKFNYIIFRSLLNAPPVDQILSGLIKFLSNQKENNLPNEKQMSKFIDYLNQHRCLVILDNAEAILQAGEEDAGQYREGYEGYGDLLEKVGKTEHQSCLLLTSREKPQNISGLAGISKPVRFFELGGLDYIEGKKIFESIGDFSETTDEEWQKLINYYNGNPLALGLVARHIKDVYNSNISTFIKTEKFIFGKPLLKVAKATKERDDIRKLLDWYFFRLPEEEKEVMYWLAINREPISLSELEEDVLSIEAKENLSSTIDSLQRRLPLEKGKKNFTGEDTLSLQPMLIEYMVDRLIEKVHKEIGTQEEEILLFNTHALIKATAKNYVRESQKRLILQPVQNKLTAYLGRETNIGTHLNNIVSKLRENSQLQGYASGNIVNLFCQLKKNLQDYDFSRLTIRQAYLQGINCHNVNFSEAIFDKSVFTKAVGNFISVAFSPDGKLFATGNFNGEISLWQVEDNRQLFKVKGHQEWVKSIQFNSDGSKLATGSYDGKAKIWELQKIWDVNKSEDVFIVKSTHVLQEHQGRIRSVAFNSDGSKLATGSDDTTIKVWDVQTGNCLTTLEGHTKVISSVVFHPDGQILASGSGDTTIKIWNISRGKCQKTLSGHTRWLLSIAFHPAGKILVSSSGDGTLRFWDYHNDKCIKTITSEETDCTSIWSIAFSHDGKTLASGQENSVIKLWNTKGKCFQTLTGYKDRVMFLAFSPDDLILAGASEDRNLRLWNVKDFNCVKNLQAYDLWIISLTCSPDSRIIASGSNDGKIRLWNVAQGQLLQTLEGHSKWVWSVSFSSNGKILASGSEDEKIILWDVNSGKHIKSLRGHTNWVMSVAFSPDGKTLASGSNDMTIKLWDISTGECLQTLLAHDDLVRTVIFSPDGKILASSSNDMTIKLWDISSGRCINTLKEHKGHVLSIAFSPDGQTIASSSEDTTIKIWSLENGECINTLEGHKNRVRSILYASISITSEQVDQIIVTGSDEGIIKMWDSLGKCQKTLSAHENRIWSMAFSLEEQSLMTASGDETIKVWNINTGEYIKTLKPFQPYEGTNITDVEGLTESQKDTLKDLGAVEYKS